MFDNTFTDFPISIVYAVFALVVTLCVAWFVLKAMSLAYKGRAKNGLISVNSAYALGARQHLYVVNYRETDYLLAVSGEGIRMIDRHPQIVENDTKQSAKSTMNQKPQRAAWL